jgi:hypothetical protein
MKVEAIGLDIVKQIFQVHGVDNGGKAVIGPSCGGRPGSPSPVWSQIWLASRAVEVHIPARVLEQKYYWRHVPERCPSRLFPVGKNLPSEALYITGTLVLL